MSNSGIDTTISTDRGSMSVKCDNWALVLILFSFKLIKKNPKVGREKLVVTKLKKFSVSITTLFRSQ